jgi:hypothetical protein
MAPAEVFCVTPSGGSFPACDHTYTTVQAALNAATGGEIIRVAAGKHTGSAGIVANITKNVKLLGGWNSDFTIRDISLYSSILDGRRLGRVVQITGNIAPTLDGFTITGGNANTESFNPGHGGAIIVATAGPIIQNNIITANIAYSGSSSLGLGGGIYLLNCAPTTIISANQIIANAANTIYNGLGGGIGHMGGTILINRNVIKNNQAGRGGGGLYLHGDGNMILSENTIISNLSTISPTAQSYGGAIYIEFLTPFTLTNNIIANNGANIRGGGIYINGVSSDVSTGSLINNTLVANTAGGNDDAVWLSGYVTVTLINNIVADHSVGLYASTFNKALADYTLFYQNSSGNTSGPGSITNLHAITGLDPSFFSAVGMDFHLLANSPAIDAGDPAGVPPAPAIDFEQHLRPIGTRVDISADEANLPLLLPLLIKSAIP